MGHTIWYRANALFTFSATSLAIIAILASYTDNFHVSNPSITLAVKQIERFRRVGTNDEINLVFSLHADLRECFSWNTKLLFVSLDAAYETERNERNVISLWDQIVTEKESGVLKFEQLRNKYRFVDQGLHLRGANVNFTVRWEVMPVAGKLHGNERLSAHMKLPTHYIDDGDPYR